MFQSSRGKPPFANAAPPPVPLLPDDAQRTPTVTSLDVFTTSRLDYKPLPPIRGAPIDRASNESDGSSLVMIDPVSRMMGHTPSPEKPTADRPRADKFICHGKRRSMSVSNIGLQKLDISSSPAPTLPPKDHGMNIDGQPWESSSSLSGILSDLKGVLSKLDPDSGSFLDLRDPCTPARKATLTRPTAAATRALNVPQTDTKSPVLPPAPPSTPVVAWSTTASTDTTSKDRLVDMDPVVPPRSSSLQTPARAGPGLGYGAGAAGSIFRHGPSPLKARGYGDQVQPPGREMYRLLANHRSVASSSEPSLIPTATEGRSSESFCGPLLNTN